MGGIASMGGKSSKPERGVVPKIKDESKFEEIAKSEENTKLEEKSSDESMTLKILTLGGSEHQVKAEPSWSVQQLSAELLEVLKLSESSTEMITMALTFRECELESSAILAECGLCEDSEVFVIVKKEPRPSWRTTTSFEDMVDDIGIFESQSLGTPGAEWLRCSAPLPLPSEVHDLISVLAGQTGAEYKKFAGLGLDGLDKVKSYVDDLFEDQVSRNGNASPDLADFKIIVSPQKLISLVGSSHYLKLVSIFGNEPDEIVVRRCQAHGRCINFHIDHTKRVMQVALNSDDEYRGGRLVFATHAGLKIPKRGVGTVTLHCNDIVHGVTELEEGIRYGLFFLDKTSF